MKHLQLDIGQLTHNKLVKKNLRLIEAVDLNWKKLEIINRPRPRGLVCSQQIKGRGRSILQWILARYYYLRAKIHWIFGSSKLIVMPFHKWARLICSWFISILLEMNHVSFSSPSICNKENRNNYRTKFPAPPRCLWMEFEYLSLFIFNFERGNILSGAV